MSSHPAVRRWPLILIAAPAAVAIWSGWVGLGGLAGFGIVHPLPGIVPSLRLNTAITLPIGVEAYGAFALGAWLSAGAAGAARAFARRSAIGALLLGMSGQVAYHLLAAWHAARAPWPVVVAVSCMPVVTLGFGAALTHLLRVVPADGSRQEPRHEWHDLAAPVAAALAARIAPSRDSTGHSARGTAHDSAGGSQEGAARDSAGDTTGAGARDTVQAAARAQRQPAPGRSEWPSARPVPRGELLKRTRSAVARWERTHKPGDRLPAVQLPDLLKLRMSRTTAASLLAEVYKPHLVTGTEGS